jgi:hypothetical protein
MEKCGGAESGDKARFARRAPVMGTALSCSFSSSTNPNRFFLY